MLDVVLEATHQQACHNHKNHFNPCCAGCSSGRGVGYKSNFENASISILVVLDVVLEVVALLTINLII